MTTAPQPFRWDGEAMIPLRSRAADRLYVIGQDYMLADQPERSSASHRQYFVTVNEGWKTLPENLADQWATPDHLRKALLIDAGFYREQIIDCGTNAAALRVAAFARSKDEFARVVVRGPLVVERTPKSQNYRAMDKAEFQASKSAVLDRLAALLDVAPSTLAKQTETA